MQELPILQEMIAAEQANEILRAWIIDERLFCSLRPFFWKEEPEVWGVLLADALHHICNALSEETGQDKDELKRLMVETFMLETRISIEGHEGEFYEN